MNEEDPAQQVETVNKPVESNLEQCIEDLKISSALPIEKREERPQHPFEKGLNIEEKTTIINRGTCPYVIEPLTSAIIEKEPDELNIEGQC